MHAAVSGDDKDDPFVVATAGWTCAIRRLAPHTGTIARPACGVVTSMPIQPGTEHQTAARSWSRSESRCAEAASGCSYTGALGATRSISTGRPVTTTRLSSSGWRSGRSRSHRSRWNGSADCDGLEVPERFEEREGMTQILQGPVMHPYRHLEMSSPSAHPCDPRTTVDLRDSDEFGRIGIVAVTVGPEGPQTIDPQVDQAFVPSPSFSLGPTHVCATPVRLAR
jgi:hypothetical protein